VFSNESNLRLLSASLISMSSDTPDHLDPDKWADMLGLLPLSNSSLKIEDETKRELLFQDKFYSKTRIHQISGVAAVNVQHQLWAKFTSKYLPSLVDRILDLPPPSSRLSGGADEYPIQNIYHTTLKFTDHAYLAKFMRSNRPIAEGGKRLPGVMAKRLVEFGHSWRQHKNPIYEGCIHRAVTSLMMLVIAAKGHDITEPTRSKLVHWLDTWAAYNSWSPGSMTFDNNLPVACNTLSKLFKHEAQLKSVIKQRRYALKCVEVCALPTCAAETNLKVCSRCKTVAFCSKAHQSQHWKNEHKKRCLETEY